MSDIVLYTGGTLGDHLPFIALGRALVARGHRVRLAINQAMHGYARRAGLEAVALTDVERGPEEARENAWAWDHWNHPPDRPHPKAQPLDPEQYVAQARELIDLCRGADLLIATAIRSQGYVAAVAARVPWLTVSLNPAFFSQPATPEERQAQLEARLQEYDALKGLFAHTFGRLGIAHALPPLTKAWLFAPHVLLASSAHLSRPDVEQLLPHSSVDQTGFWFYEDPAWPGWQPSEELRCFCERRPLVLSFSSQPLEDPRAALALHARAAARLGMPLVVQRGWAGFAEADLPQDAAAEVMLADFLPHDWLFAHAACAIQHGGIGSIARALRQGCPLLVEPYGNDQLYNAMRVARLGVGAALHPFQMTLDELVRVLSERVLAPECRERAEAVGARIRGEDGLEVACRAVEIYLARVRSGEEARAQWPVALLANPTPPPLAATEEPAARPAPVARPAGQASIPTIVHQSWKDANVPGRFAAYQRSWQGQHPSWRYYLWTDADNREFLRRHYPWFLPIYDDYPVPIMRADAVRYFILHHYGGVYADLDAECLRPLEPLLAGKELVLGLEPPQHLAEHRARGYPLDRIVSNAIMAAAPGHPFWEHVFRLLIGFHQAPGPLDATGPFLLTRAVASWPHPEEIDIQPAEVLLPLTSNRPWHELPEDERGRLARRAFVLHHWAGTWWRQGTARQSQQAGLALLVKGGVPSRGVMRVDASAALLRQEVALPRISCLMVTGNRPALAERAVRCFQRQTYANKELVVVDDGEDGTLAAWLQELDDPQIALVRLPAEGKSLGELRNLAVAHAGGAYVAQWDDDDLSHPRRLEMQMAALWVSQADACLLERQMLWWPQGRRLAVSYGRAWEGSFLCAKGKLPPYPEIACGEDTPSVEQLLAQARVALLDYPQLYTYVFHGQNTFPEAHWEQLWQAASERYEGDTYDIMLQHLQEQLQTDLQPRNPAERSEPGRPEPARREEGPAIAPVVERRRSREETGLPTVLILTPVKDAALFLPHFWSKLRALSYPHRRLSLAFLESDSGDGTYDAIARELPALQEEFAGACLCKRDYAYRAPGPRWEAGEQFRRRAILARSRNYLLSRALADEEWALWIDVDVARWPDDVIERLLATGKDIVVPNCLQESTGQTFDYNTFKLKPGAEELDWSLYILNGILLPPHGYGRLYLSDLRQHELVEVDAVGGTMLLVRADAHREGLIFPTVPYRYLIETEGLAAMARDMGYRSWGLPNLEIWHP